MPLVQQNRFLASKKLYALNPASYRTITQPVQQGVQVWSYALDAVWFTRRANGRRAATFGHLWGHSSNYAPVSPYGAPGTEWTYEEFLTHVDTARDGGSPLASWDGQGTWWAKAYADDMGKQQAILPLLQTMLANYPQAPAPYQGWYLLEHPGRV